MSEACCKLVVCDKVIPCKSALKEEFIWKSIFNEIKRPLQTNDFTQIKTLFEFYSNCDRFKTSQGLARDIQHLSGSFKWPATLPFSNSNTLNDQCYHSLSSDATILILYMRPLVNQWW